MDFRPERITSLLPVLALALVLASCASTDVRTRGGSAPAHDSVVLVSIDAFRPADMNQRDTPNLSRIAREGVRAAWMNPSYPSLTFPNHYSIVTGLRPDHQGIVHNTMRDSALGGFKLSNRMAVGDARWWGGEPIWVGVEKAGLRSATMFWPGSEAAIEGVRPWQWRRFDETISDTARVDTVLGWLDVPAAERPRFVALYFDRVDTESHHHGPDSTQARDARREVDAAIGRLLDGLARRGELDRTNLIVVSDHGMATVPPGHYVAVEDMVTREEAAVVTVGQVIGIAPNPGFESRVEKKLIGKHDRYDCWRKADLPARWHYGTHPRIPPIVCQMHEGWDALGRETIATRPTDSNRGSHGYDPALPSMRALFLARGPSFKRGATIAAFDNVDVYPLLARLIGIAPAPNDGDIAPLLPALVDEAPRGATIPGIP